MPTEDNCTTLRQAARNKNQDQVRAFLQRDDAKELLLMKCNYGTLVIHDVQLIDLSCLQLILDAGVQHGIAKEMLEEKTDTGRTCLQVACRHQLSIYSLRLVLEYYSKYTDIKTMLQEKDKDDMTCLHWACFNDLSTDSLQLLISFFPSKDLFTRVLCVRDCYNNQTPVDYAPRTKVKKLLEESDCFEQCRLWLFINHQDTVLYSLYPNSLDQTCQALKELKNGLQHSQQHSTIMLIALISSSSKFREAISRTDSSAPMSNYFDVVKKGDKKSDYNHWRRNIHLFRDFLGQWPPGERKTARTYEDEGEGSSSCSIQ